MKKILASIIIAMMLISVGVNVFADRNKKYRTNNTNNK